ncbi:MAG: EamA family transporter [Deltaproteobacteria bacterium]|nr:EamA family transporter [Deltaproteobacteria bacterium]
MLPTTTTTASPPPRLQLWFAYAVLYLVWGSTYLAMKTAVQTLPPFSTAALRFVFSGVLLVVIGRLFDKTPIQRGHLLAALGQGVLLLVCGNAAVMWAMKTVPSGVGALILAITPLFMALLGGALRATTWVGLALGTLGIGILVDPFSDHAAVAPSGVLLLVFASAAWAVGSLLPKRLPPHPSNATATGLQMLVGATVQFGMAQAMGEEIVLATTTTASWLSLLYLAVMGSLLGFTCYGWLLKVEPPARVATYAYVNPVVAVLLGAAIGGEQITTRVVVAAAVIVVAVVLILRSKR